MPTPLGKVGRNRNGTPGELMRNAVAAGEFHPLALDAQKTGSWPAEPPPRVTEVQRRNVS